MLGCNKISYTLKWTCSFQLLVCLSVCNYLLPPCMKRLKSISVPIRIHCKKHIFFSIRVFFHRHWRFTWQQGKRGDHLLFHSTTSTHSRTLRHLFATLHVRWLSRIFNCNACVYQTATRWDLPPYWITIWLIDWLIDNGIFVYLLDELILGFCYGDLTCGKLEDLNSHRLSPLYYKRIDYPVYPE